MNTTTPKPLINKVPLSPAAHRSRTEDKMQSVPAPSTIRR